MSMLLFALAFLACQTHRLPSAAILHATDRAVDPGEPTMPESQVADPNDALGPPVKPSETLDNQDYTPQIQDIDVESTAGPSAPEQHETPVIQPLIVSRSEFNVERANRAIQAAIPCGGQVGNTINPALFVGCEEFVVANAGRVRFPNLDAMLARFQPYDLPPEATLGPPSAVPLPNGTVVELARDDGSWQRLNVPFGAFHGFVWAEEARLYLGYASWNGECGGQVVYRPSTTEMMVLGGTPVFSPDGSRLAAAEYDVYSDGDFSLRIFDLNPTGATKIMRRDYAVGGSIHRVERLKFDDAQTLWVDMTDGDRVHTVQIDIDTGEMTRIFPEY